MVSWVKGKVAGPFQLIIGDRVFQRASIASHLQLHTDLGGARRIQANRDGTSQGVVLGTKAFQVRLDEARQMLTDSAGRRFLRPAALAKDLLRGSTTNPLLIIDMRECSSESSARRQGGAAYRHLREHVYDYVRAKGDTYDGWIARWWQPWRPRDEFFSRVSVAKHTRLVACSRHAARPVFVFLSTEFCPTESLQIFDHEDDYSFGILQSNLHWDWAVAKGSRIKQDTRYTAEVWSTFPWPQAPRESAIVSVAQAGRHLRQVRHDLMEANGWSLRALYQAAEVPGPHPLNDAQARLDEAVAAAYDMPGGQEPLEFLLELNLSVAEDEEEGHPVLGPGLPPGFDPHDPRWFSEDCIEPPPLDGDDDNA